MALFYYPILIWVVAMQLLLYVSLLVFLAGAMFAAHWTRFRGNRDLYVFYVVLLWILAFIVGQFNYKILLHLGSLEVAVRYSSSLYVLIFTSILLVYILEGVRETRNIITVSIIVQLTLAFLQLFLGQWALPLLQGPMQQGASILFDSSVVRILVSIVATVIDLFFAVFIFQVMVNRFKRFPTPVLVYVALLLTILLDAALFVGGTRYGSFLTTLSAHLLYKSAIVTVLALPLGFYITWFKKRGGLDLERGSFDIFQKLDRLEDDLYEAHEKLKEYAENLEEKVKIRTRELEEANDELREYQRTAERDMLMAVNVQQNLIPKEIKDDSWDIAVTYKPMSGVSGDFYDFYERDGKLLGVSLFDVSGHGIASGLITVLAKPVVMRVFTKMRKSKLSQVMRVINSHLVQELEPVDNYLTGLLLRFDGKNVEYVNAGHTDVIHIAKDGTARPIDRNDVAWKGMFLGIEGMDSDYKVLKFALKKGEALILYSDCLLEASNGRQEYGMQGVLDNLAEAFALGSDPEGSSKRPSPAAKEWSAQGYLDHILKGFYDFVEDNEIKDDLTALVVKRKD